MSSASMSAKSRLFAYQRLSQLRVTGQAEAGRVDFLSHILALPQLPTVTYTWHVGLLMRLPRPLARAVKRLSVAPCST